MAEQDDALTYDVATAAKMAGESEQTIRAWLHKDRIKGVQIGRKWKIYRRPFDALLSAGVTPMALFGC